MGKAIPFYIALLLNRAGFSCREYVPRTTSDHATKTAGHLHVLRSGRRRIFEIKATSRESDFTSQLNVPRLGSSVHCAINSRCSKERVNGHAFVYLTSAAATQRLRAVELSPGTKLTQDVHTGCAAGELPE